MTHVAFLYDIIDALAAGADVVSFALSRKWKLEGKGVTLGLSRTEHGFKADKEMMMMMTAADSMRPHASHTLLKPGVGAKTVEVPMSGGLLTLGAYYINVTIGSQPFLALVDTGSSNIWVTGYKPDAKYAPVACNSPVCQKCNTDGSGSCLFGPPMCENEVCQFGITYGGGGSLAAGPLATDTICVGGLCTDSAPFGRVETNLPPGPGALSAIVGLAFERNACNPSCVPTLFDSLVADNAGVEPFFGMCLTQDRGGVIDVGFVNTSRVSAPFVDIYVTHEHWYNIEVVDFVIDGHGLGLPELVYKVTNDVIGSFVDSGTSLLLLGSLPFAALAERMTTQYASLPGMSGSSNFFTGACFPTSLVDPQLANYPAISVAIKTNDPKERTKVVTLAIPASSYLLKAGSQRCLGIASVSGIGAILGDVFLENYYTVYYPQAGKISIAEVFESNCVPS
ncbi:pregnancy-associated glycoprotein 6 [Thecamonas trahens ATCC 50062]|uniref:Pregnancy-associated glycoprotein 6 n=1 Tax=Thecamonas trahens ATCC 50062 TaxID=461836 RepID=A0A0L0DI66_THETB|nr:pregnancy-associated glycoprotein 6 [Thecamonas trahens ATCC 50062]KNC52002.1 pregnancy-associated glycoprotein 6 [Thecamonas trahens ATCC 50062]|eukprot:XP_013755586.1 pregnancy-associated glycoprotein 6 [Thecamonas trahens ATCC 50062]